MVARLSDQIALDVSQTCQLARVRRVLEILEDGDDARYVFQLHGTPNAGSLSSGPSAAKVSLEHERR